jgi:hypothetical protein
MPYNQATAIACALEPNCFCLAVYKVKIDGSLTHFYAGD